MPQSEYVQVNCQPLPAISDTGFQVDLKKQVSLIPYFHRGMAIICGLLIAVDLMLGQLTRLSGMSRQFLQIAPGILLLFLITIYCMRRGYGKMAEITLLSGWAALHTNVLSFLIQAAGRVPVPMIDPQLGQVDRAIGFSTAGIVQWIGQFPLCRDALAKSYDLITPLILVALFVPVLFGHTASARRYVLSVLIAGEITALLFSFLPAVGPWSVQEYNPTHDQGAVEAYHRLLRTVHSMQINQEVRASSRFRRFMWSSRS